MGTLFPILSRLGYSAAVILFERNRKVAIEQGQSIGEARQILIQKTRQTSRWLTYMLCAMAFVSVLFGATAYSVIKRALQIRALFFTNLEIVSPYLSEIERLRLRASFAAMTTKDEYSAIQSQLQSVANAHTVKLRAERVE